MKKNDMKYLIQGSRYPCCCLISALNSLIHFGMGRITQNSPRFQELVDIAGCRYGPAIHIKNLFHILGLEVSPIKFDRDAVFGDMPRMGSFSQNPVDELREWERRMEREGHIRCKDLFYRIRKELLNGSVVEVTVRKCPASRGRHSILIVGEKYEEFMITNWDRKKRCSSVNVRILASKLSPNAKDLANSIRPKKIPVLSKRRHRRIGKKRINTIRQYAANHSTAIHLIVEELLHEIDFLKGQ